MRRMLFRLVLVSLYELCHCNLLISLGAHARAPHLPTTLRLEEIEFSTLIYLELIEESYVVTLP